MRAGYNMAMKFADYQWDFFGKIQLLTDTIACGCNFAYIATTAATGFRLKCNEMSDFLWWKHFPRHTRPMLSAFAFGATRRSPGI